MSGHLNDLSPKQEADLAQFKINLSDVLEKKHDDSLLLQFLRARCFDLKKSEEMIRKHLDWRKRFPDNLKDTGFKPVDLIKKYVTAPFIGFDKEGSPVRLVPLSYMDLVGVTSSIRLKDIKEFVVYCLDGDKDALRKNNEKFNRQVETRTFVFDLKNMTFRQLTHKTVLDTIASFLKLYEANYPENLKVAFVINVPYFFAILFNLVKTILTEDTVRKIRIFGKDGWKEEITNLIDPDLLPEMFGGTKTGPDGDPYCPSMFGERGPLPDSYYLRNQGKLNKDDDDVQKVIVPRRDKKEVEIVVIDESSTIIWDIECLENDLFVGIFYKENESENASEEVVRPVRFGSDFGPTCGAYVCQKQGKYALVFDNTYSILRSKQVLYRINVIPGKSRSILDVN